MKFHRRHLSGDERRTLLERCLEAEAELERSRSSMVELRRRLDDSQAALHELGRENQSIQVRKSLRSVLKEESGHSPLLLVLAGDGRRHFPPSSIFIFAIVVLLSSLASLATSPSRNFPSSRERTRRAREWGGKEMRAT